MTVTVRLINTCQQSQMVSVFVVFVFPLNHEHILLYQGCKQNNFELFRVSAGCVLHVTVFQHLLFDNYSSLSSQYLLIFCFSLSTRSPTVCCFFPTFFCAPHSALCPPLASADSSAWTHNDDDVLFKQFSMGKYCQSFKNVMFVFIYLLRNNLE